MLLLPTLLLTLCSPACGFGPEDRRIELHHHATGTSLCLRLDTSRYCGHQLRRHWDSLLSAAAATPAMRRQ